MAGFTQWHAIITSGKSVTEVSPSVINWLNTYQSQTGEPQNNYGLTPEGEIYQYLFAGVWNPSNGEIGLAYSDEAALKLGLPLGTFHIMSSGSNSSGSTNFEIDPLQVNQLVNESMEEFMSTINIDMAAMVQSINDKETSLLSVIEEQEVQFNAALHILRRDIDALGPRISAVERKVNSLEASTIETAMIVSRVAEKQTSDIIEVNNKINNLQATTTEGLNSVNVRLTNEIGKTNLAQRDLEARVIAKVDTTKRTLENDLITSIDRVEDDIEELATRLDQRIADASPIEKKEMFTEEIINNVAGKIGLANTMNLLSNQPHLISIIYAFEDHQAALDYFKVAISA